MALLIRSSSHVALTWSLRGNLIKKIKGEKLKTKNMRAHISLKQEDEK